MANILKMGQNSNITGGENDPGLNSSSIENILKLSENQVDPRFEVSYQKGLEAIGATDGDGSSSIVVPGVDSLFNPFYLFRYAKFGEIDGAKTYQTELHKDLVDSRNILKVKPISQLENLAQSTSPLNTYADEKKRINNPSASKIIEYFKNEPFAKEKSTVATYPYQWNDFLWCKYYGKIPNNRLLTLRRYPIPVEDNIQISDSYSPLIPIAQAVTWWGAETGNTLQQILGIQYGFKWTDKTTTVEDIIGNEISASAVPDLLGLTEGQNQKFRQALVSAIFANFENPYAGSGLDDKLQDWVKESYSKGAYWNRILGPVNVIDKTQIRDRGFTYTHDINLTFTYSLRSFANINPKIAFLDLITNFLSLTHNKADFWGGSARYFKKTGFILPGIPTEKFEQADFAGGIKETLTNFFTSAQGKGSSILESLKKAKDGKGLQELLDNPELQASVNAIMASWSRDLIQKPLTMRSFLDGRAVGEWHLTVGNPFDPIAVIGNLCVKSTTIKFSEAIGLDDFPSEISFTVTLTPGRPRAKQDIESMFNLGGGPMGFTPLAAPSSAYNSYGERNSSYSAKLAGGGAALTPNGKDALNDRRKSAAGISELGDSGAFTPTNYDKSISAAENNANAYRGKIRRAYGSTFAESKALPDYFRDLKFKD
jgi:hypothetical protein